MIPSDAGHPRLRQWLVTAIGALIVGWSTTTASMRDVGRVDGDWFTISHTVTNNFHTWCVLPPLRWIVELSSQTSPFRADHLCSLFAVILYVGALNLLQRLREDSSPPRPNWFEPVLVAAMMGVWLRVVGKDTVVLSALAFFPMTLLSLERLLWSPGGSISQSQRSKDWGSFAVAFGVHLLTALQLSVVTVPLLGTGAFLLRRSGQVRSEAPFQLPRLLLWICLPPLAISCFAPVAPFPSYPVGTHLIPDDGVPGMLRPMFGWEYPMTVINRELIRSAYQWSAAVILLILVASWMIVRPKRIRALLLLSSVPLLLAVTDVLLPEALAVILPGQTLPRVVPGLFFFSLTPLLFHCGTLSLLLSLMASPGTCGPVAASGAALALLGVTSLNPSFQRPAALLTTASPSLAVVQAMADSAGRATIDLPRFKALSMQRPEQLTRSDVELSSNTGSGRDSLQRMLDHRPETRWSSGAGRQLGREDLVVKFISPQKLDGLVLDPGAFPADFPRGVVIEQCDGDRTVLTTHPSWQGTVVFPEDGLPAFAGQEQVRIIFPQTVTTQCLVVKQIGTTLNFDWSIAELKVLRPKDR
jgi:hypothetical protein